MKTIVQASQGIKQDCIKKITKVKNDWSIAQVVQCLPNKQKALHSPQYTHKRWHLMKWTQ
jgi:hypothetical protein